MYCPTKAFTIWLLLSVRDSGQGVCSQVAIETAIYMKQRHNNATGFLVRVRIKPGVNL